MTKATRRQAPVGNLLSYAVIGAKLARSLDVTGGLPGEAFALHPDQ